MVKIFDPLPDDGRQKVPRGSAGPQSMIDLPLPGAGTGERPLPPPRRPKRLSGRWLALLLLVLALVAVAAYLVLRPAPPEGRLSTGRLDFGEQQVERESEPREVRLANDGEKPLAVAALRLEGAAAEDFSLAGDGCTGAVLGPGQECAGQVRFRPVAIGTRGARLVIESNAANAPLAVELSGSGAAPLLAISPQRLDFEPRAMGGTSEAVPVRLANQGSLELEIQGVLVEGAGAADFRVVENRCSGRRLGPGAECELRIAFAPKLQGERSASLRVRSNSAERAPLVELGGLGTAPDATLAFEPAALDFGSRLLGAGGEPRRVRLRNPGSARLPLARVLLTGDGAAFTVRGEACVGRGLGPGAECAIGVAFTPRTEGAAQATLSFEGAAGVRLPWELPLRGTGVKPRLATDPERIDFGRLRVGGEEARTVRIGNRGTLATGLRPLALEGPGRAAFVLRGDGCSGRELGPGAACTVEAVFAARREGASEADLVIDTGVPQGAWRVRLEGTAVEPRIEATPAGLDFGEVRVGSFSDRQLTLSSAGSAGLVLAALRLGGDAAADYRLIEGSCPRGRELPPGATCALAVRFWPQSAGRRAARLEIEIEEGARSTRVSLDGVALPPPPAEIAVSPDRLDFGLLPVGERSGIQTLRIANPGDGRLVVHSIEIEGPQRDDFRLVPGTCQGSPFVAARSDCTAGLRFNPSAPGERRARLVIRHNAPGAPVALPLTGRGG